MTKVVSVAEIDVENSLDGSLDELINKLIAYRDDANRRKLTNVRTYTDYEDDDTRRWKLYIMGDGSLPHVIKLPPEQYNRIFKMGMDAKLAGEGATSPYNAIPSDDPSNEAWYAGYNSI